LAATFEVTKRTIYRDMLALLESGVPVVSVPGQGYSLVEGYFLPPVRFSTDEALLLLLGANFAAQNFDAQYQLVQPGVKEPGIRRQGPCPDKSSETAEPSFG
jgi:predicted DNA-binding transcriptional regulator YafY